MAKKFYVQHVGYPVAGRAIWHDEWKLYSTHATESAAWKRVRKAQAHLQPGQWDDHYRVIGPDGRVCDYQRYLVEQECGRVERWLRRFRAGKVSR